MLSPGTSSMQWTSVEPLYKVSASARDERLFSPCSCATALTHFAERLLPELSIEFLQGKEAQMCTWFYRKGYGTTYWMRPDRLLGRYDKRYDLRKHVIIMTFSFNLCIHFTDRQCIPFPTPNTTETVWSSTGMILFLNYSRNHNSSTAHKMNVIQ